MACFIRSLPLVIIDDVLYTNFWNLSLRETEHCLDSPAKCRSKGLASAPRSALRPRFVQDACPPLREQSMFTYISTPKMTSGTVGGNVKLRVYCHRSLLSVLEVLNFVECGDESNFFLGLLWPSPRMPSAGY